VLEHDAACGGLAEARLGAGKKYRFVQYITVSTGIGSCFVVDKEPLKGQFNSEGGKQIIDINYHKFEHQTGSFEQLVSGKAIKDKFGMIAAQIDPDDERSWRFIAHNLSVGIYNFIMINSPEIVILGGGVSIHFDKFDKYLDEYINQYPAVYPLPKIVPADYVETAPVLGAILLASEKT
jgi:predicted NBD/HSP70 family sugar kinase